MKIIPGHIVALLTALVLMTSPATAVDFPHNTANGYTCASCHQSHSTLGTQGYTNLCLTCHNPADGKAGNKSFVPGDASNPFGNATSARPGILYQTSHNWSGSDNVPPAGALPPLNPQMTKDNMRGTISCVRCHNVKNPRSSAFNSAPFLRALNERDAMCLDCHRLRNSTSHLSGTHPVTVSYSVSASARPAAFYAEPVNSNPGNPTSALKLVGGEVLCSTCHRAHFADSNSATYDSATSARQGNLAPSAGRLLRTDLRGASAAATNICTNCHAGKASHNNRGQDIQCADCHSGHVAYDANAVTDEEKLPNVFLIRRYMNISSSAGAVRNGRVFFQYTGSARNYVDYRGTGVCQGCHAVPQGPGYPPEHASTDANVCATCHGHQSVYGTFTANCGFCHGFPPPAAAAGYAGVNETTSPHRRHATGGVNYQYSCNECHKGNSHNTGTFQDVYNDTTGILAGPTVTYTAATRTCANIACHGGTSAVWEKTGCLGCHSAVQGNRAAVTGQFGGSSHHVQGTLTDAKCYQCHWEANSDGTINPAYHGGMAASGSPIDLVIYGAAIRPTTFTAGATAVQYTANGTRGEIQKITSHCLGCHSDGNNASQPFGDGKTPKQYAWDGTSVAARYAQAGKTTWGKYSTVTNAAQKRIAKSLSAHGNAAGNQRGWNTTTGVDGAITNTSGGTGVQCYDCHNSHGSSVAGITSRYSSATGNKRGGLLKETVNGQGGYATTYKPQAGGSAADKNVRSPGASICLDCHMSTTPTQAVAFRGYTTPWGYNSTYGATQAILGYWDSPYMGYSTAGAKQRYPYKKANLTKGGHFGASSPLSDTPMHSIDGLCTPCHDPHGVSPTLGADQQYAVPLLKGTWVTSPYKEDVSPTYNSMQTALTNPNTYRIDQNTFGSRIGDTVTGVKESVDQFAGLCLQCHARDSLTDGTTHTWKSKDRVHESVKGWKTANGTIKHTYTCSKCHSPHTSSVLPRLMVSNCLDSSHKGRTARTTAPYVQWGSGGDYGYGNGRIPGVYDSFGDGNPGTYMPVCHENNTGNGTDQWWNEVTPWPSLEITSVPAAGSLKAVGSNVQATITWGTNLIASSYVDYGLTTGYGSTAGNGSLALGHSVLLPSLVNHSTYHYRARSTTGRSVTSGDQTFYISMPPTVPTLITRAPVVSATSTPVTLQWNASTDPDVGPVEYNVEVDTSSSFASANKQSSGWISGTNWTPTLATNATWYWRVQARDGNHTTAQDSPSAWSATSSFILSNGAAPPAPTLASPANGFNDWSCDGGYYVGFSWNEVAGAAEYLVQVSTDPSFATVSYQSPWVAATSWGVWVGSTATYYWKVQARNSLSLAVGPWSSVNSFTITDTGPCATTCPMVYTWDGAKFAFESDVYTKGKLALKYSTGFLKPNPNDYYLLLNTPAKTDGAYELKIVEERAETDYLDSLRLYTIDLPENRDVYTEILFSSTAYVEPATLVHTVDKTLKKPLSATRVDSGEDVSGLLAAADGNHVVLSNDRNLDFNWQTVELDLGNLSSAPQVKLIVDAVSAFPTTPAGLSRASSLDFNGQRTKIEVFDASGNWVNVPKTTKELPIPKGFRRPYVLDISNIFPDGVHKVRLSFLYKTYIDAVFFDTTADEPVSVNEVPLVSATLDYYGFSATRGTSEIYEHIYGDKVEKLPSYMPGNYTRYGDVGPLLTGTDDKFVIFGSGDEVTLRFNGETDRPAGTTRRFLMYFDGYYKAHNNVFIPNTVEPLPFAAMSNFPYDPAVESYPTDADHELYRKDYNTRVYAP